MNNDNKRKYVVKNIKRDMKNLGKETIILSGSALLTGIATLGTLHHGEKFLESFFDPNYFSTKLHALTTIASLELLVLGILGIKYGLKKTKASIKFLNLDKEELQEISKDKIKVR